MSPGFFEESDEIFPSVKISLKEQITILRKNDISNKLFLELAKPKSPIPDLLLRHPDDLFPKLDPENAVIPEDFSISLCMVFRENFEELTEGEIRRPSITDYLKDGKLFEENESLVEYEEPVDELTTQENMEFQELVLLNGLRLIQHNPHLLALAQKKEEIILPDIRKALGQKGINYKPIEEEVFQLMERFADDQGIGTIFKILFRRSDTDTETAYEIKKMAKEMYGFIRELLIDVPELAGEIHRMFPNVLNEYGIPFFRKHNIFTFNAYRYKNQEYNKALNFLWELDLLRPVVISLICLNCHDAEGKPIHQVLNSDISPNELDKKIYCSWCKKPIVVEAFYSFDSWLNRVILTEDKLLSYLVAFLLDEYGLEWTHHIYTDSSEHDFHVKTSKGLHLIECKVFRVSGPIEEDKRLQTKVRNGIYQVVKHMEETKANSAFLVCNPCSNNKKELKKWVNEAVKQSKLSINKNKIKIIGQNDLLRAIKQLD